MSPQEKAEELFDKYRNTIMSFLSDNMKDYNAQQCALIAVYEMIRIAPHGGDFDNEIQVDSKEYFIKVKEELEKI